MIYIYSAAGVLILLLAGMLWVRGQQLHRVQASNASLTLQIVSAEQANDAQKATIAAQEAALAKWKQLADEATDRVQHAIKAVNAAQAERDKANLKMLELDAQDAARKECAAVLAEDISVACPDISRNMILRAKDD